MISTLDTTKITITLWEKFCLLFVRKQVAIDPGSNLSYVTEFKVFRGRHYILATYAFKPKP